MARPRASSLKAPLSFGARSDTTTYNRNKGKLVHSILPLPSLTDPAPHSHLLEDLCWVVHINSATPFLCCFVPAMPIWDLTHPRRTNQSCLTLISFTTLGLKLWYGSFFRHFRWFWWRQRYFLRWESVFVGWSASLVLSVGSTLVPMLDSNVAKR
ncbi:hypothetical protein EV426DRAFT_64213 [Tirmania nivea]|nr:hypothetical protein EV426DRAFT_64213 [Tirmania nivea]